MTDLGDQAIAKPSCPTCDDNLKPGTPQWWRLWEDYRQAVGRSRGALDQLTGEAVHSRRLEAEEGFAACIEMLDAAETALRKATEARRALHEADQQRRTPMNHYNYADQFLYQLKYATDQINNILTPRFVIELPREGCRDVAARHIEEAEGALCAARKALAAYGEALFRENVEAA
jgi:hypothetical protein